MISRWVGVGSASLPDAKAAGAAATEDALRSPDPRLLLVFSSESYDPKALLEGIEAVAPEVELIGCTTAGEIAGSGPGDAGVVVLALGGDGFSVATSASAVHDGLRSAGAAVASCASKVSDSPHRALLLLTDGLAGDQQEIVRGAYSVVGAEIPLVGGCAGDGLKMEATLQFHGADVLSHSVVAAVLGSEAPLGIGVHHGWRRVGEPMLVSSSDANRVFLLDDEPALDVYLRRLYAPDEARNDAGAFTRFALTHPLGLSRRSGEEVRFVAGADFADRSLTCVAHVPQGGLTWFMEGDAASVMAATDAACLDALGQLQGAPPLGFVAFDCIARRGVLGAPGITEEVTRIAEHARGAPVAGFYTYGEIARTQGTGGFHNQTLVVLALA
ncbi:MAG TPA: FIST N-terminal domain-containing protein [Acidimicrobiales bacterium]|nr:FIST N-terminal domain-containing protein [Acidimicrobiales bacterium]